MIYHPKENRVLAGRRTQWGEKHSEVACEADLNI